MESEEVPCVVTTNTDNLLGILVLFQLLVLVGGGAYYLLSTTSWDW